MHRFHMQFNQLDQKVAVIQFGTPQKSCGNAKHGTPPKQPCDPCHAQGKSKLLESFKTESNVGTEDHRKEKGVPTSCEAWWPAR